MNRRTFLETAGALPTLNGPAVTVELLSQNATVGLTGFFNSAGCAADQPDFPRHGFDRGDGQARWDFSLIKHFRVTEKATMTPNTTPRNSAVGTITKQDVRRNWTFSLKPWF